jgi:hypothetical protein
MQSVEGNMSIDFKEKILLEVPELNLDLSVIYKLIKNDYCLFKFKKFCNFDLNSGVVQNENY